MQSGRASAGFLLVPRRWASQRHHCAITKMVLLMEVCINTTTQAQLEANIEHLSVEQTNLYNDLPAKHKAAFLATIPAPVEPQGNMHIRVLRAGRMIGTLTIGKSLAYACDNLEGTLQYDSDRLYAGEITTEELLAEYADPTSESHLEFIPTRSMEPPTARMANHSKQVKGRPAAANGGGFAPSRAATHDVGA